MRRARLFESFVQDLRYAARTFLRSPGFTVTAVLAIAVGIAATSAVFSVVDRVLFRSLPYGDPEALASIGFLSCQLSGSSETGKEWLPFNRHYNVLTVTSKR